jgi:hypothetical protein
MTEWVWAALRILGRSAWGSRMTDHSPSDKLGVEIVKAVAERATRAQALEECAKAVEAALEAADRVGIRDEELDAQARATLVNEMKRMSPRRRWRLPRKSKRHASEQLSAQQMPRALPPVTLGSE